VKEPLAFEPTQDAAMETARKLEPDSAIHVQPVAMSRAAAAEMAADLIDVGLRRALFFCAFVLVNNSWASSVRFGRFSSTCRLRKPKASPTLGH
jgi:hypothetical protein